jgi:hypothetical protein
MGTCLACTIGKAKQKNVKKKSEGIKSKEPGGCVYLDISTVKDKKGEPKITKKNWRIMVDESTNLKISHFYAKKDGMVEPTCELIKKLKNMEIEIQILRVDNAGENKLLQQRCESKDWQFAINYEYTGRDTPHHNHMAELRFATLGNKGRALKVRANIPMNKRYLLFREAFKTATDLDSLVVTTVGTKKSTRHEHFYGKNRKWMKFLRTWGEAGTVKVKTKTTPKLADRGVHCMFIG